MTLARTPRWTLGLSLAALTVLAVGSTFAPSPTGLANLLGSGPVDFGSMLTCGFCIGIGASMVASDSWVAFLAETPSWRGIALCAAACVAVFGG